VISKNPAALTGIPKLDKPIIMIRDPRAVLTSTFNDDYFVSGNYCQNGRDYGVLKNYKVMTDYPDVCIYRYEHLVARPDQMQDQIGEYWGLQFVEEFSTWPRFPEEKMTAVSKTWADKMNEVRPIDTGHNWRDHMQRVRQQFDAFPDLHDIMVKYGYEPDRKWYDEVLDSTVPQALDEPSSAVTVKPKPLKLKLTIQQ